jgi:hypothetical protein
VEEGGVELDVVVEDTNSNNSALWVPGNQLLQHRCRSQRSNSNLSSSNSSNNSNTNSNMDIQQQPHIITSTTIPMLPMLLPPNRAITIPTPPPRECMVIMAAESGELNLPLRIRTARLIIHMRNIHSIIRNKEGVHHKLHREHGVIPYQEQEGILRQVEYKEVLACIINSHHSSSNISIIITNNSNSNSNNNSSSSSSSSNNNQCPNQEPKNLW